MPESEDKSLKRIKKKVDHTLEMADVLSGKKPVGGKLGKKLEKEKALEADLKGGKQLRDKKFKDFDKFNRRIESIVNKNAKPEERKIKIRRISIIDPNTKKVI